MFKKSRDISSSSNSDHEIYKYTPSKKNSKKGKAPKKTPSKPWTKKRIFALAGKVFVSLMLIGVIVMSLVITGLTVYVMKGSQQTDIDISKEAVMSNNFTTFYGKDAQNNDVELCRISSGTVRVWTDIQDIPDNVKNAYVAIEDKRFYEHEGVDFKRTFLAFLNMFLHFYDSQQGGSTITQQMVKNITNDRSTSPSRKVREISRAMSVERVYSKDQILQAYLNIVPIGGGNGDYEGVAAAAKLYFNKSIKDVTLAEAASIAAITKSPYYYEPIGHPDRNKKRRDSILANMYDQGMITQTEYQEAVATPVETKPGKVVGSSDGKDYQSYFVDAAMNEIISDLSQKQGIDTSQAEQELKTGGYRIYTTIDPEMQSRLEEKYMNPATFGYKSFEGSPESAFVVYDMYGRMKAVVGGTGTKPPGDRSVINRATSALRRPGSSIKPLSVYAPAIQDNLINFSSVVQDQPLETSSETGKPWPQNYSGKYSGNVLLYYAVEQSLNTIPARLVKQMTPKKCYNFLTQKVGFTDLQDSDINISPLALGNFTQGVHLNELTNAYQIFGNGGKFTKSHTYYTVQNAAGNIILQSDESYTQAISSDTSSVMNRLLRNVVLEGTGARASLDKMGIEVVGKTGTTDDFKDYTFIGMTHDYIAGIWLGYDDPKSMGSTNNTTRIWNNIMTYLMKGHSQANFDIDSSVIKSNFCTSSGQLSNGRCPTVKEGYYRPGMVPSTCTIH